MYSFINEIIKTYNTQYNFSESKIYIKHNQIQSEFNKNKIISNYQKYKIFFTFDDIEKYFNDSNNRTTETIDCNINNEYDEDDNNIINNHKNSSDENFYDSSTKINKNKININNINNIINENASDINNVINENASDTSENTKIKLKRNKTQKK